MTDGDPVITEEDSEPACPESSNTTRAGGGGCGVCGEARLLLVSGASYAECDGVYSLTNLTSVWDSKHIVYSRLAGGDNRWSLDSFSTELIYLLKYLNEKQTKNVCNIYQVYILEFSLLRLKLLRLEHRGSKIFNKERTLSCPRYESLVVSLLVWRRGKVMISIFQGEEGWPTSHGSAPGMTMSPLLS